MIQNDYSIILHTRRYDMLYVVYPWVLFYDRMAKVVLAFLVWYQRSMGIASEHTTGMRTCRVSVCTLEEAVL